MLNNLYAPKDAAPLLGLSVTTITRCVKRGAPVHRWGSSGHRYRIDLDEFRRWMEDQGGENRPVTRARKATIRTTEEMALQRRQMMAALRRQGA